MKHVRMRPPSFKAARRSMRHQLGWYMAALAVLLIAAVCIGLFSVGRLSSPGAELERTLHTQMDFFQDDMRSLWQNVGTSAVHLSADMTDILEDCLAERGVEFDALTGDLDTLTAIEDAMLDPLCQYIRQTRCSGIFVILDAAMRTDSAPDVRSGLYIQKNNAERNSNELLLFRGMPGVSKARNVMPHRKWQQEFRTAQFPNYAETFGAANASAWESYRITDLITLPGTSEEAILLTIPMAGAGGTVYGLCGFAVNQTYFCSHFEQPSDLSRLACILTTNTGDTLDVDAGLVTYTKDGSCNLPTGTLSTHEMSGELLHFSGSGYEFVGKLEQVSFTKGDSGGHTLAILIPKEDYDSAVLGGMVQTALFAFLLLFFAVACCVIFARRFLKPVYEDMKRLQTKAPDKEQMVFDDFDPLTRTISTLEDEKQDAQAQAQRLLGEKTALQSQFAETQSQLESAQRDVKDLADKQKDKIDPDIFSQFKENLDRLTKAERRIYDAYISGMDFPEIAATFTAKESTLRSQTQSVYKKLGVNSLVLLRRYAALLRQEEARMAE